MNPDKRTFFEFEDSSRTADGGTRRRGMLGFSPHEIPILIAKNLLKPLGHPAHNGPKHFLTATLKDLERDEKWHGKAADAVMEYWRHKNARKQDSTDNGQPSRLQTQTAN